MTPAHGIEAIEASAKRCGNEPNWGRQREKESEHPENWREETGMDVFDPSRDIKRHIERGGARGRRPEALRMARSRKRGEEGERRGAGLQCRKTK